MSASLRTVHIIGGGLAGLGLGLGLRRAGAPVVVHEAGTYPRHRVCGEFISGLSGAEAAALGLEDLLAAAPRHRETAWFRGGREILRAAVPEPAIAISRHELDAAMARRLVELGGQLRCGERVAAPGTRGSAAGAGADGWVAAHGRRRRVDGRWLGLKAHFSGLPLTAPLEMHLGRGGYAGLTSLGGGLVNVCALLPAGPVRAADKSSQLPDRLHAIGLGALASRVRAARGDGASVTGVTHFELGWQRSGGGGEPPAPPGPLVLGDGAAIIPPFTGHGMAMALQSAVTAMPFLLAWSRAETSWELARAGATAALHRRFAPRLRWACALHPLILDRSGQAAMAGLARVRMLPFAWLFCRVR